MPFEIPNTLGWLVVIEVILSDEDKVVIYAWTIKQENRKPSIVVRTYGIAALLPYSLAKSLIPCQSAYNKPSSKTLRIPVLCVPEDSA